MKLQNKVALITGGSSGIGLATAKLFIEQGAKVIVTGTNTDKLNEAQEKLGDNLLTVKSDTANLDDINQLYELIESKYSKIDVIFANAGIARFVPFEEMTCDIFDKLFNVNFKGMFFTIQKMIPLMNENGSIILNASIASNIALENGEAYAATKACVRSLGRSLAKYLATKKIRVNTISPGAVVTPIYSKLGNEQNYLKPFSKYYQENVLLKRSAKSHEIANCVLFLASDDASYVNGIELFIDGGFVEI